MRVLQVAPPWFTVPPVSYGGSEQVIATLVDGLVGAGHEVTLVASGESRTTGRLRRVFDTPPSEALGEAGFELLHVLAAYLDEPLERFDVIHDHTQTGIALGAVMDGPPVVHTLHGPWTELSGRLYQQVSGRVALVAISHDQADRAPADIRLAGVVHHGMRLSGCPRVDRRQPQLAFVGRANAEKGPEVAIEVARRTGRPLAMLLKVNEPAEHDYFQRFVMPRLGDAEVTLELHATRRETLAVMARAHAVLFPIRWHEPFGLVMLEANACGTPVVAFARGAADEVIVDGETGFVVPPDDLDAMCDAVERVGTLDAEACRSRVAQHFSVERMVDGYLDIYRHAGERQVIDVREQSPTQGAPRWSQP